MKKFIGAAVALAGMWFGPAMADDEMRPYVGVGYGYVVHDRDRKSHDGEGAWVAGGLPVGERVNIEASAFVHKFDPRYDVFVPKRWKEIGVKFDGMYFLSRNAAFSPYLAVGIGLIDSELRTTGADSTDSFADVGAGFTTFAGFLRDIDVGLRFDARYRYIDPEIPGIPTFDEPVVRVGVLIPLGDREAAAAAAAGAATAAAAGSSSSAAAGGGKDSDGDGVADASDKCPGTARGLTVDANGCPVNAASSGPNRSFENVSFAYDDSELTDYAKATLDNAAGAITGLSQKYPKLKVDVSGHTDWVGTDSYNQALSERRANTVKKYLVKKGVDGKLINTFSYGESKPIAPNDTDEGRAINRRAEVRTHE